LSDSELKKKEMIEKLNIHTDQYERSLTMAQDGWRADLKVGDYVDAINIYSTPNNIHDIKQIRGWAPAKVTNVTVDQVTVSFLGMPFKNQTQFTRQSIFLAEYLTYTDDFDAR
jgi:hypothetical protein